MGTSTKDFIVRSAVGIIGAAMLGVGGLGGVDLTDSVLVVWLLLGAFILLMALFWNRVRSLSLGHGDTKVTAELASIVGHDVAKELSSAGITQVASAYAFVHSALGEDAAYRPAKVKLQDALIDQVRTRSFTTKPNPKDVAQLAKGSPAERVLAVGLLRGDPSLVTIDALRSAITDSKSGNEQYHGLLAAKEAWGRFDESTRRQVIETVNTRPYAGADSDRDAVAAEILARGEA
ncbi:MAG TPA: hypothetical protein VGB14_20615 [Acidimicrobiales bacterium]